MIKARDPNHTPTPMPTTSQSKPKTMLLWLEHHKLANPHSIPTPALQREFDMLFEGVKVLWPQPGGQEHFRDCEADLCFYGGEAGAGKSWNLLFDHVKWIDNPLYIGIITRRTYAQIFSPDGLWYQASQIYPALGGKSVKSPHPMYVFPSGAQIHFKHSQHASNVIEDWQGPAGAQISVDEVTQFTQRQFLYILGRNRSKSGVNPYMRMTCNPDPFSWVRDLIDWWIDKDGYVIPERSGVIKYVAVVNDKFVTGNTAEEVLKKFEGTEEAKHIKPLSFTFVRGYLEENQALLKEDPLYKSKLEMLSEEDKMSMSRGNWNEVNDLLKLFQKTNIDSNRIEEEDFDINKMERIAVGVDPAGGAKDENDETGIVCAGVDEYGEGYVWIDETGHYLPSEWADKTCSIYHLNLADIVAVERNYGGDMVESTIRTADPNINVKMVVSSKGKFLRAEPVAALYRRNKIHHVGHKLEELEKEMRQFKQGQEKSPNRLDALVFALTELLLGSNKQVRVRSLVREETENTKEEVQQTEKSQSNIDSDNSTDKDYNDNDNFEKEAPQIKWRY